MFWALVLGLLLVMGLGVGALVGIARRMSLDPSWYGLAVLGAGATVLAWMVMFGVLTVYTKLVLPAQMSQGSLMRRFDVLLIVFVLFGIFLEGAKSYGVKAFDTTMTRGDWPLFGVAVGLGAGLIQAFWLPAARILALSGGVGGVSAQDFGLLLRGATLLPLEAVACSLVMVQVARNKRWQGVAWVGGAHGVVLMMPAVLTQLPALGGAELWLGSVVNVLGAVVLGLVMWRQIKVQGWPT